jgi:hypothetical protein
MGRSRLCILSSVSEATNIFMLLNLPLFLSECFDNVCNSLVLVYAMRVALQRTREVRDCNSAGDCQIVNQLLGKC